MTIARVLEGKGDGIATVTAAQTVREVVAILAERRIGAVPVIDGGRVVGIFSERDLLYCAAREGGVVLDRTVGSMMTAPAITVGGDESVLVALSVMTRRRIRHLPVVEDDRLVGFVSIGDLVKYRMDRIEADAAAMRDYIRQV